MPSDREYEPYEGLYIHIPFCKSKCGYCDFDSKACSFPNAEVDEYFENLVAEVIRLSRMGELSSIQTVYIGGGTPTFAGSRNLSMLLYALGVAMSMDGECTIEANPDSFDERMARDLRALGVNRISLGVQSLDNRILKDCGRAHDSDSARKAMDIACSIFDNVSVDVMCGLPGQTSEDLESTLDQILSRDLKHVSVYPLSIEEGTPFERLYEHGELLLPSDDECAEMMELASSKLQDAGFPRYEVSNFARPGYESRHNLSYWKGKPYLGLGRGATSMRQNALSRERLVDGQVIDRLDPEQKAAEDVMLAMRMSIGISDEELLHAETNAKGITKELERLEQLGLAEHIDGRWRPTDRGWLCGNELFRSLMR